MSRKNNTALKEVTDVKELEELVENYEETNEELQEEKTGLMVKAKDGVKKVGDKIPKPVKTGLKAAAVGAVGFIAGCIYTSCKNSNEESDDEYGYFEEDEVIDTDYSETEE